MNSLISLGKYLFAAPMAIFGVMHFVAADVMAANTPGGVFMVYFTGAALLAASISIFIGKLDKLASILLGIMLLLFVIPHIQKMGTDENELIQVLKNISLAGAAFMYATIAKDSTYVK